MSSNIACAVLKSPEFMYAETIVFHETSLLCGIRWKTECAKSISPAFTIPEITEFHVTTFLSGIDSNKQKADAISPALLHRLQKRQSTHGILTRSIVERNEASGLANELGHKKVTVFEAIGDDLKMGLLQLLGTPAFCQEVEQFLLHCFGGSLKIEALNGS
nr:hypothetical protein CFOL_v3_04841 [Ipomoea batatas]